MHPQTLHTTLFLLPGGRELALPENTDAFKAAMQQSLANKTARIIMLADKPLIPENVLHTLAKYKTVLLIESGHIVTEEDAWKVAYEMQTHNYLPVVTTTGFDYQVVQMEFIDVKYEDFERLEKFM